MMRIVDCKQRFVCKYNRDFNLNIKKADKGGLKEESDV